MNVENILRVAQAIEDAAKPDAKPEIGFCMNWWDHDLDDEDRYYGRDMTGHGCGTVCCIGGWTDRLFGETNSEEETAARLGLSPEDGERLFYADELFARMKDITPTHAVAVLRHLAATGVVDWTVGAPDAEPSRFINDLSDDREALASAGIIEEP